VSGTNIKHVVGTEFHLEPSSVVAPIRPDRTNPA
jgi:hypothetical protein